MRAKYTKTLKLYMNPIIENDEIIKIDYWDDKDEKYVFGLQSSVFHRTCAMTNLVYACLNEIAKGKTYITIEMICDGNWKYNEDNKKIIELKDPMINGYHMKTAHFVKMN